LGFVLRVDPTDGTRTILSDFADPGQGARGGCLFDTSCAPLELTVDLDGALLVVHDNGSVYRVDPSTGFRTIVANFNDRTLEDVAVERSGAMLITDSMELPSLLGRILRNAPSVGTEIVSDFADPQQGPLGQPRRMTVDHAGTIFVTTWGIPIIRIDALTGTRRILTEFPGQSLGGLAVDEFGALLVVVPDWGPDRRGALFRVDPTTGAQTLVSDFGDSTQGAPGESPYDVAVVPTPVVNDSISMSSPVTSFDPSPLPDAPAGTFVISATFTNISTTVIAYPFLRVTELSGGNVLLNADGGAAGVGARLTVDVGHDGVLSPGDSFTTEFVVGLQAREPFTFDVNVLGVPEQQRLHAGDLTETAKLMPSDPVHGDGPPLSFALSADGSTALIGAGTAPCIAGARECGAAYLFVRSKRGVWTEQQKLLASDAAAFWGFGQSVALSADGSTALIGAPGSGPGNGSCPAFNCGAGYVFARSGDQWIEQQKLTGSDAGIGATFGWSVALSHDGNTALIGAFNIGCPQGAGCHAVYAFQRDNADNWTEQQKLTSPGHPGDNFGRALTLSGDGETALIGAHSTGCFAGGTCGKAYVFVQRKSGIWVEEQDLVASDAVANAAFGFAVSLSSRGTIALIGAPNDQCPVPRDVFCGSAYLFERQRGAYTERQKFTASYEGSVFGISVALAANGRRALIGDPSARCSDFPESSCGAAYMIERKGRTWVGQLTLRASDEAYANTFGSAVGLARGGREALVGTDNPFCLGCGAAYIFQP